MTVTAEITEAERNELANMATLLGVDFAVMAGCAIRRGLEKGVAK